MDWIFNLIGILGTVFGAIGIILTINSNIKNKKIKTIDWTDIQSATKYFWRRLQSEHFVPDIIITPGQKGGIIAQLINDFYKKNISILSGFIEKNDKKQLADDNYLIISTTKWNVHIPISVKYWEEKSKAKILIVDDFVMSGDFLYALKQKLKELGYIENNMKSCAIATTKVAMDANKGPSYYWRVVEDRDFYFPWGKAE